MAEDQLVRNIEIRNKILSSIYRLLKWAPFIIVVGLVANESFIAMIFVLFIILDEIMRESTE